MQLGYVFVLSCSVECTLACFMFRLEILREDWLNLRDQMRAPVEPDRDQSFHFALMKFPSLQTGLDLLRLSLHVPSSYKC